MPLRSLICAAFVALSAESLAAQALRPLFVGSGAAEVLIVDERAAAMLASDSQADSLVSRCAALARVDSDRADPAVLGFRAWEFGPGEARDPETITFLLLPVERGRLDCRDSDLQRTVVAGRGVRFSSDTTLGPGEQIVAAALYRGDVRLDDGASTSAPLLFVTPWGNRRDAATGWRVDVALDQLAVASWGTTDDVYFLIRREGEVAQRRIGIPAAIIDSLWDRAAPRRAVGLPSTASAGYRLLGAPTEDRGAVMSHQALVAGELRAPVLAAAQRVVGGGLSTADRRALRINLASSFAESGDLTMARHYLSGAFRAEPCLTLNPETPPALAQLAAPLERYGASCQPRGPIRFVLTGGLVPGLTRPFTPKRVALGLAAVVGAALIYAEAGASFERGRAHYRDYLAVEYTGGVPSEALALAYYDKAESARQRGVWLVRGAALLVAGSVAEGAWSEWKFNAALRALRDYGVVLRVP